MDHRRGGCRSPSSLRNLFLGEGVRGAAVDPHFQHALGTGLLWRADWRFARDDYLCAEIPAAVVASGGRDGPKRPSGPRVRACRLFYDRLLLRTSDRSAMGSALSKGPLDPGNRCPSDAALRERNEPALLRFPGMVFPETKV